MNVTWSTIKHSLALSQEILAQAAQPQTPPIPTPIPPTFPATASQLNTQLNTIFNWGGLINLGLAVLWLVIGLILAWAISVFVENMLKRTNIDNQLAAWLTGQESEGQALPIEKWIATAVFWIIMLFALVAFFNQLQLTAVSEPLTAFLSQVSLFLPKLVGALILLGFAWLVATVVKFVVSRTLRGFAIDERLNQAGATPTENQVLLSDTLANALYWFIFLLFLPPILDTLNLQQALEPINNLVNQILSALPKILKAGIIAAAGWLLATVVRRIVANLLAATGTDQLGARFGIGRTTGSQSLSWIGGTLVYVLILIPTAIAALNALEIDAISVPAVAMLNRILSAIPNIFTAGLILVIAYFLGRFVADLVSNILTGIGFNNIFSWLGLQSSPTETKTSPAQVDENATVLQQSPQQTPSEIVGIIVLVGIMLFATITATDILGLTALTAIITQILEISGRVLIGIIIFAIGLYFANLAFNLIRSSGTSQSSLLAQTARIAIIVLVGAMALQQMGIAPNIVNLAFGLLLGALAVAVAIAFGLGGREIAAEQIRAWLEMFKDK